MTNITKVWMSLTFRVKAILAVLSLDGKELRRFFSASIIADIQGWANFFDLMPGIRSWDGGLPYHSKSLARNEANPPSSEQDVIGLMYDLARLKNAKCIIEVGIYKGACSTALAQAIHDNGGGELHCIDIFDGEFGKIQNMISKKSPLVHAHFHHGNSVEIASRGLLPKSDVVFIDADHSYESVRLDIKKYWPLVAVGGVMILHDTIMWSGVRRATAEMNQNGVNIITLGTSGGSGISLIFHGQPVMPIQHTGKDDGAVT